MKSSTPQNRQAPSRPSRATRRRRVDAPTQPAPAWWWRDDQPLKAADFIARTPVFRMEEFRDVHVQGGRSPRTSAALLAYHVRVGHLRSLRRGVYATTGPVDPWVLGSRLTGDAVLAYDGALSFHGFTGLGHGLSYLTQERPGRFTFNEVVYRGVKAPAVLGGFGRHLEEREHAGQVVRVTSRERTLVDCLDRLDLGASEELDADLAPTRAGWPLELWALFAKARGLDLAAMVDHAWALRSAVVAVRLGFFLAHLKDIPRRLIDRLEERRPTSPTYFDRKHRGRGDPYVARWNLVVPAELYSAVRR